MAGDLKMTRKEAKSILGDVRAYLASRASLENELLAGHSFIEICNAIKALNEEPKFLCTADGKIKPILVDTEYYQEKYNHTIQQINKLAQMMHDNALMYQNLLDHNAQGKINPYADIERWMNMIFDEDFL